MIGLVFVTHGNLALEFVAAMEHVVGHQNNVECVCIGPEDNMEERRQEILQKAKSVDNGQGVLLLTDMFGGSVNNNAMVLTKNPKVHVVTGINLAAVISIIMSDQDADTEDIIKHSVEQAKDMIMYCNELASNEDEDDDF